MSKRLTDEERDQLLRRLAATQEVLVEQMGDLATAVQSLGLAIQSALTPSRSALPQIDGMEQLKSLLDTPNKKKNS